MTVPKVTNQLKWRNNTLGSPVEVMGKRCEMLMNRANFSKVRANQGLSVRRQPWVPPTITMLRISEWQRNTQYINLQSLDDGSSSLLLPKSHAAFVCKCAAK